MHNLTYDLRIGIFSSARRWFTLSLDETKANETKQFDLPQPDSVVYQVHRLMSPITAKMFSRSGIYRRWPTVLKFGLILIALGVTGTVLSQSSNSAESASGQKPDLKGKNTFERKCATCHGLDGHGGEHAPDIVLRSNVKALANEALLTIIHNGIPEEGMPGLPTISGEDAQALISYLRFLQGKSTANSTTGNPARGHDLFFGKAGCSTCHQIGSRGRFVTGDLAGFARDHAGDEIRDAIVRPSEVPQETVTAVARDGRKFSGMVRNEDNASLQLQDDDGRLYLLMMSSLVSVQRKSVDPMPADYGQRLSSAELDDLIGYILREASAEIHAQD